MATDSLIRPYVQLSASALILWSLVLSQEALSCQTTATGVTFGQYDAITNQPTTGMGIIRLNCPSPAVVRLSAGMHSQGGFATRMLASADRPDHVRYNLYLDPMGIRIWGDGAANTFVQQVPSGNSDLQIYAVVPGGQRAGAGSYHDMITVIVDW